MTIRDFSKFTIVTLLAASAVLIGCSKNTDSVEVPETEAPAADVIKIGVFEPLTGANAAGGTDELAGIKLAHKLMPTVLGRKIELVIADNQSDQLEAAKAASVLAQKEKVNVVLGSWGSSLSMSGGAIFEDAKIPAVTMSATNPSVTKGNDYYFRVCFLDPFQGMAGAAYAFNTLRAKKVAVIREVSNDFSVGLARFFVNHFIKLTGDEKSVVATADYNTGDREFITQLRNIQQSKPDVIFAPGNYTESALIIRQARDLGINVPFIGGDSWEAEAFLKEGGNAVEGVVFSTFFASDEPINKTSDVFLKAFRKEYKKEPAAVAALGFDAYNLVLDAIARANSANSQKIRDALAETKGFEGAAGTVTINADGDAEKPAIFKTVRGGKFAFLSVVTP